MANFKVSEQANNDLYEIALYTEDTWGRAQRRQYLEEINRRFHQLAENPHFPTSKDISHIKQGCYASPINQHLIIYRKFSYGIRIVRVLGQIMNL